MSIRSPERKLGRPARGYGRRVMRSSLRSCVSPSLRSGLPTNQNASAQITAPPTASVAIRPINFRPAARDIAVPRGEDAA